MNEEKISFMMQTAFGQPASMIFNDREVNVTSLSEETLLFFFGEARSFSIEKNGVSFRDSDNCILGTLIPRMYLALPYAE